ncbi:MAG: riboflavin synthase, partial [Bacteroidota bacterium]
MFTGIIERTGRVEALHREGTNVRFAIRSPLGPELRVDQSVSHNGVCLTVTSVHDEVHEVVAIDETLQKSNLGSLKTGSIVNLERCMAANGRFDGHIVQGHVDTTGKV